MGRFFIGVFVVALSGAWLVAADANAGRTADALRVEAIRPPETRQAAGPSLTTAPDGTAWLSWIEVAGEKEHALRFATFERATKTWSAPRTIARGRDWFVNWADFPAVEVSAEGRATAVWFVNNPAPANAAAAHDHDGPGYRAFFSTSPDRGATWSAPAPVTTESTMVEFVSLATLADGRVLAAWLDGRARKTAGAQQLYARILGAAGPDALVDPSVCDCCSTSLTALLDGTALVAYRGRTKEEVRDIRVARFDGRAWGEPRPLNHDGWRINGCPVNGPQLASDGGRVGVAWFTAADNEPRVFASFSSDAGAHFLMPLRLDAAKPTGRVDVLLLHDTSMLATWVGADGAVWMRRVSPDFATSAAVEIAPRGSGGMRTVPRAALLRDYRGGDTQAEVLVAFAGEAGLRTALVAVPEGALLQAEKNCDCAPTPEELLGFPIRGTIVETIAATQTVRVKHPGAPGIFAPGTHDFAAPPELLPRLPAGRQFLARIDRREGRWWLFDVRLLAAPP